MKKTSSYRSKYRFLKEKASDMIIKILDRDVFLQQRLIELCTCYSSYQYLTSEQVPKKEDECEGKLLTLAECQFKIGEGLGTLCLIINLNNFINKKGSLVYITFEYSISDEYIVYSEEISRKEHLQHKIPNTIFYRYLPLLAKLSTEQSCRRYLKCALKRCPSGFAPREHL